MQGYGLGQIQATSQRQEQRLSQAQIQALSLLALSAAELRDEIFREAAENPALEIADGTKTQSADSYGKGRLQRRTGSARLSDRHKVGAEKSDKFQSLLEAAPDTRKTLREQLLLQLELTDLSPKERAFGKKLIDNLDGRGFHILSPQSLLEKSRGEDEPLLAKMLAVVQGFEPHGVCCANIEESLLLQAKNSGTAPPLAIFFLSGHLEMLAPPLVPRIKKKLLAFRRERKRLDFATNAAPAVFDDSFLAEENIAKAVQFVRTLNPHPAAEFGTDSVHYVSADATVTLELRHSDGDDFARGLVARDGESVFHVELAQNTLPAARVAQDLAGANAACSEQLQKAAQFVRSLEYRSSALLELVCHIVRAQKDFFSGGPSHLAPLTRTEVAEKLGVHVSTVSRLADSKYLDCAWGLFPLKYFFETGVKISGCPHHQKKGNAASTAKIPAEAAPPEHSGRSESIARGKILSEIKNILAENQAGRQLSDARLSALLADRGLKIARRTVAKYRSMLEIGSSYDRT